MNVFLERKIDTSQVTLLPETWAVNLLLHIKNLQLVQRETQNKYISWTLINPNVKCL